MLPKTATRKMSNPFLFVFFLKRTSCLTCFKQKRQHCSHCSWGNWKVFFSCSFFCFLSNHCFFFFSLQHFWSCEERKTSFLNMPLRFGSVAIFYQVNSFFQGKKKKGKRKGFHFASVATTVENLCFFFFFLKELFLYFQSNFFVGFILSNFVDSANFIEPKQQTEKPNVMIMKCFLLRAEQKKPEGLSIFSFFFFNHLSKM